MYKKFERFIIISTYICVFVLLFKDWITGLLLGTALGVVLTDNNDKTCCK